MRTPHKSYPVEIIGNAYIPVKCNVEKLAKYSVNVLFVGETGSGKEVFAKHYMNSCKNQTGNRRIQLCTGSSDELLHSTVFGHVKGAYTNAIKDRPGLIETCENGVIFLDELGDASDKFQSMILRVSEGNSYSKLGSDDEFKPNNVLFIAATNKPEGIRDELKRRFKEVYIPPLQICDIPIIATHFFQEISKNKSVYPTKNTLNELMDRDYPGNIRELRRTCIDMLTEKSGSTIKQLPNIITGGSFDYERYKQEFSIWKEYLKPLIDKYGPHYLKYKYMEWDPNWVDPDNKDRNFSIIMPAQRLLHYPERYDKNDYEHLEKSKLYEHSTLDLIEWLRMEADEDEELPFLFKLERKAPENYDLSIKPKKPINDDDLKNNFKKRPEQPRISSKDVVPKFRQHMREVFDKSLLPLLLELIYQNYNTAAEPLTTIKKPALTPLLDLPLKEAEKEFRRITVNYNLKKHSNNKTKTAEALGVHPNRIYRALKSG